MALHSTVRAVLANTQLPSLPTPPPTHTRSHCAVLLLLSRTNHTKEQLVLLTDFDSGMCLSYLVRYRKKFLVHTNPDSLLFTCGDNFAVTCVAGLACLERRAHSIGKGRGWQTDRQRWSRMVTTIYHPAACARMDVDSTATRSLRTCVRNATKTRSSARTRPL